MTLFNDLTLRIAQLITARLTEAGRAKLVRDSIPIENLVTHLPKHLLTDFTLRAAARLSLPSIAVTGSLGTFAGNPSDTVILRRYALAGTWAPRLQSSVFDRVFHEHQGTLIDVGANIGLTCIPAVGRHAGVRSIAIEADPGNFKLLLNNIDLNSARDRVEALNLAAHSCFSTLDFELSNTNFGDHRIRLGDQPALVQALQNEDQRHTITVNAAPLDAVIDIEKLVHPVVMKVDTQGAEPLVFEGARRLLGHIDCLVVEFSPYTLARAGQSIDSFFLHLDRFDTGFILPSEDGDPGLATADAPLPALKPMRELVDQCRLAALKVDPDIYFDLVLFPSRQQPEIRTSTP